MDEVVTGFPEVVPLAGVPTEFDLYLGALGFEPRCVAVPQELVKLGCRCERVAYFVYGINQLENERNRIPYEDALSSLGAQVVTVGPSVDAMESWLVQEAERFSSFEGRRPVVVLDISVATNRLVLAALKALLSVDASVIVTYAEAATYFPLREDFELNAARWSSDDAGLESGVGAIDVSVEYPGYQLEQLPHSVVVVAGFGRDRARSVIQFVDPSLLPDPGSRVVWVLGVPHLQENAWRIDAQRVINDVRSRAPLNRASTFDYREVMRVLEDVFQERSLHEHLTVAPLGSKLQALGVALFCQARPEVRVVFAAPEAYRASAYSESWAGLWRVELGATDQLRGALATVDTLSIEPVYPTASRDEGTSGE